MRKRAATKTVPATAPILHLVPRAASAGVVDVAREQRITAIVQMLAVAHQIARRQIAAERGYAA